LKTNQEKKIGILNHVNIFDDRFMCWM